MKSYSLDSFYYAIITFKLTNSWLQLFNIDLTLRIILKTAYINFKV